MSIEKTNEICNLIETYSSMLTTRQQDILHDYYFLDLSLSEIAENYEVTRQAVKDILDRAVKQCYVYEEKLQVYKKSVILKDTLNDILQLDNLSDIKNSIRDIVDREV